MRPDHFDAIVVGSGFGGSVTSYRLAEAGLDVCLLERGRAYPPGSFPRAPHDLRRNFWDPSEGLYGMFDVWSFRKIEALVSSALGGGSIIYANVLLRKDEKWFVREDPVDGSYEPWPVSRVELDPHYDRVEQMLAPQRYPRDRAPYAGTPKTRAFVDAARAAGLPASFPPLAVTFANEGHPPVPGEPIVEDGPNLHGRTRYTCRLCGECDVGCNYGSKNTLDYNYLTEAERLGADIRTLCEVRRFAPDGDRWKVWYVEHELGRRGREVDTRELPLLSLTADHLVLAAGTLGTTYLMLSCRDDLPGLSDTLGSRFCGNGDLLSFVMDARKSDGDDGRSEPRVLAPDFGPVITTTVRVGDALDGDGSTGRGFYVQDAGHPVFLSWIAESSRIFGTLKRLGRLLRSVFLARWRGDTNLSAEIRDLVGARFSSSTMPLLGMGRDRPTGRLSVRRDERGTPRLTNDWELRDSREYFERVKETMGELAEAMGGKLVVNPTWLLGRVVTVHPLGGCPMGRDEREGVVDDRGEVFNHPGLFVADGSVLPGPCGPNPALTIAALADRTADHIIERARKGTTS